MPRQDVPYGGAICRLKERIAEIWDKLGEKLHSINGVEGDGAGDVKIVSGDDAVVINNDQIGHRIEVTLDSSKLPAAAVSSVNGQTGAVRLDALNILSDGDSNVQADIDLNKAAINGCFDGITSEQVARQNADAALQTNINAVQASLDGRMTAAESKNSQQDTAIGALQAADSNNVKITGTHKIGDYAVLLTGNQDIAGDKNFLGHVIGNYRTGRITATDNLDITSNYDGIHIYYIYMSKVSDVAGLPSGIENGGAILLHSREYGYADTTNNYVYYLQVLFSSTGKMYTRRHISTTNKSTQETAWGNENWKLATYTEVTPS